MESHEIHVELDEEPKVTDDVDIDEAATYLPAQRENATSATRRRSNLPTPEGLVAWLIQRCRGRFQQAVNDPRRGVYTERIHILQALKGGLANRVLHSAVVRNSAEMANISEGESSPTHKESAPISLDEAERVHSFFDALRFACSNSSISRKATR